MRYFSTPWIWIRRFRHRRGYGVHSPFAYSFLQQVIYERLPFYAFHTLDASLPLWQRQRRKKVLHMLARLANYVQADFLITDTTDPVITKYLQAGCRKMTLTSSCPPTGTCFYYLEHPDAKFPFPVKKQHVMVIDRNRNNKTLLEELNPTVYFDLGDLYILFFNPKYNKQHYIINFE